MPDTIPTKDFFAVRRLLGPGRCLLMMGPSGSGKSTAAAQLAAELGAVVVSYDDHQRRVAGDTGVEPVSEQALTAAWAELDAHCAAGMPVIVDGTHCQPERRTAVREIASAHGLRTVVLVLLPPLDVCLERQQLRARRVPPADVARQHAAIAAALPALTAEGHAAVLRLPAAFDPG
ncbi:AAA family ATPase [Streptomyces sp. URMC 127]|uniref:AAA family ATPase n=1 Tax=Streptomyces sp. URMC 127 TaxID=3423402 RepID=UPI003F19BD7B